MDKPRTRKEQEVWQACDDLLAMGKAVKEITGEAIGVRLRELKYKAGSTTQRYQFRDSWMAARGLSREDVRSLEPNELTDPIARATAVYKEGLERELQKEYEQKYQSLEALVAERQAEADQWQAKCSELQIKLQDSQQQNDNVSQRYKIQSDNLQSIHEENISLKSSVSEQEKQLTALQVMLEKREAQYLEEKKTLSSRFDAVLEEFKVNYQQQVSDLRESAEEQRHRLMLDNDQLKTENKKLFSDVSELQCAKRELEASVQHLQQQLQEMGSLEKTFSKHSKNVDAGVKKSIAAVDGAIDHISRLCNIQSECFLMQESCKSMLDAIYEKIEDGELVTTQQESVETTEEA